MGIAEEAEAETLFKRIKQRLTGLPGNEYSGYTIFRVPAHIRRSHRDFYEPHVVSIGPYHRGQKDLRAMEEHKWRYLSDFLSRRPGDGLFLKSCVEAIKFLEDRARRCYFESFDLDSQDFPEMLLLDGCFILELLMKRMNGDADAVTEVTWNWNLIKNDLLMLENQIPFFVLQEMFDLFMGSEPKNDNGDLRVSKLRRTASIISSKHSEDTLLEILIPYLMWGEMKPTEALTGKEIHHLLHLYHLCFVPKPTASKRLERSISDLIISFSFLRVIQSLLSLLGGMLPTKKEGITLTSIERSAGSIPCATKLLEAGLTLKKESSLNFLDISFRDGVLGIPFLSIDQTMKSRFMNLVALEQCCELERNMASYAAFMDCLINTSKDIAVLQECGIMDNRLANNEEAALFLNQLDDCAAVDYEHHYLAQLFREVNAYCQTDWHRWRAILMGDYFHSPWAVLSSVAAFILLVLTFLQTYIELYSYYHPPSEHS